MLFASLNVLFVYVWHDNLLGIISYIDQYIELNNIEHVQWALCWKDTFNKFFENSQG